MRARIVQIDEKKPDAQPYLDTRYQWYKPQTSGCRQISRFPTVWLVFPKLESVLRTLLVFVSTCVKSLIEYKHL